MSANSSDVLSDVINIIGTTGNVGGLSPDQDFERWVYAFLQQHRDTPTNWPDPVRNAPAFSGLARAAFSSIG